jgi:hypothetical protein
MTRCLEVCEGWTLVLSILALCGEVEFLSSRKSELETRASQLFGLDGCTPKLVEYYLDLTRRDLQVRD